MSDALLDDLVAVKAECVSLTRVMVWLLSAESDESRRVIYGEERLRALSEEICLAKSLPAETVEAVNAKIGRELKDLEEEGATNG